MKAENKRFIKQFLMDRLWSDTDKLRVDLDAYAIARNIDSFEAIEEYEYQVERIQKMLACYWLIFNTFIIMTKEQIEMLRFIIKDEIEAAGIDGMEHGVWGWAEKQLDESWEKFRKSFEDH